MLQPGGIAQHCFFIERRIRIRRQHNDVGHSRLTARQGARFVKRQRAHLAGLFQRDRVFDQDAMPRPLPDPDHDRRRCRQAQRTRAGNHEHSYGIDQGNAEDAAIHPPADERQQRNTADDRHKHGGNPIGQTLDGRF